MNIRPLDDRLVVKQAEAEMKTATGIFLPEGAKEKPTRGKVISTGPGKMLDSGKRAPSPSRRTMKSTTANTPAPK